MNKNLLTMTPKSPMMKAARLVELETIKKAVAEEILSLKADLLKVTQDLDVKMLKTGSYTISRAHRVTPQVENFEILKKSLTEADIPFMTEEVFAEQMKPVFKTIIEEGRELAGLESLTTEYIMVRITKKDENGK